MWRVLLREVCEIRQEMKRSSEAGADPKKLGLPRKESSLRLGHVERSGPAGYVRTTDPRVYRKCHSKRSYTEGIKLGGTEMKPLQSAFHGLDRG